MMRAPHFSHPGAPAFPPHAWELPGLIGAIRRDLDSSGLDPAISTITLLACVSLLTQGLADVTLSNGMASRIGASSVLVGHSGAGKTLSLKLLASPIHRRLEELLKEGSGLGRTPLFFIEDATREAVILHLVEWGVAGLITDEGGQLKSLLKHGASTLAKLVDGAPLFQARVYRGRAALKDHRLTVLAMMQPDVFDDVKALLGVGKGGVGLINRFLLGWANPSPGCVSMSGPALTPAVRTGYENRVNALLGETIESVLTRRSRPMLHPDRHAERRVLDIADQVALSRRDPSLSDASEYVSRHTERIIALAGAIHVLQHGAEGEIQLESIEAAHRIGLWSISSFIDLTQVQPKPTQTEQDAARIEEALFKAAYAIGPTFNLSVLRDLSPNIGLTPARFNRALPLLAGSGKVTLSRYGRETWASVNPPSAPWLSFNSR